MDYTVMFLLNNSLSTGNIDP